MFKRILCLTILTVVLVGCTKESNNKSPRRGVQQEQTQSSEPVNQSKLPPKSLLNIDEVQGSGVEGSITFIVSGTPHAIVQTERTSVQLDAQGKGKIVLPFDTSPDISENSFEFIAQADGYEPSSKYKVVVKNLLYNTEKTITEEERKEQERQRELAEMNRIKDDLRPKLNKLNEYHNEWLALYRKFGVPAAGRYGIEESMRIAMQFGDINGKIQSVHDPIQKKWYSIPASEEGTFEGRAYEALWNYSFALVTSTPHTYERHRQDIQNYKQAVSKLLN